MDCYWLVCPSEKHLGVVLHHELNKPVLSYCCKIGRLHTGEYKQLYKRHVKQGSVQISTDKTSAGVQHPFLGTSLEERPIKKPQ